jgi:tetratricopeptide (TPR) repeat protein
VTLRAPTGCLSLLLVLCTAVARADPEIPPAPEPEPSARPPLSHYDLIRRGMRHNFAGEFEAANRVWRELRELDPAHPAGPLFEVSTLYWFQMFDESVTRWDAAILAGCVEAIALAQARLDADPDDLEGNLYMGLALMNRGRLRGIRGKYVKAGTDGEVAREHLERVLELRPDLVDGRFQIGLYYYYASLVPRIVSRFFGWLWFVPSGDGPTGLRYLHEVLETGDLFRDDAAFMLVNIYTYHEPEFRHHALVLVRHLHERFPRNALIHFELIELLYLQRDWRGVIAEASRLEAETGGSELERGRRTMATVWRARAELLSGEPQAAWQTLAGFGDDGPQSPNWAGAWINLTRGQILDVQGERGSAVAEYRRVLAYESPKGSERASELAEQALQRPFRIEERPSMRAAE